MALFCSWLPCLFVLSGRSNLLHTPFFFALLLPSLTRFTRSQKLFFDCWFLYNMGSQFLRRKQPHPLFFTSLILNNHLHFLLSAWNRWKVLAMQRSQAEQANWYDTNFVFSHHRPVFYVPITPSPLPLSVRYKSTKSINFSATIRCNGPPNMERKF